MDTACQFLWVNIFLVSPISGNPLSPQITSHLPQRTTRGHSERRPRVIHRPHADLSAQGNASCQTFPADQEEQMPKALSEETVNYFLPLGRGPPSVQQNEFVSSWRRQDSFHKVVKPKEKHVHTKSNVQSAGLRVHFPP